jgi:hypothetical protein
MIDAIGLSKTYAGTGRPALNNVSLHVPKGRFTASSAQRRGQKYADPLSESAGAAHIGPHYCERTGYYADG